MRVRAPTRFLYPFETRLTLLLSRISPTSLFLYSGSNSVSLLPRIVDKYRRNLVEPLKNSPRSVSNRAIIEKDRE